MKRITMKRILDGKRYDTEAADLVAAWSNGVGQSDHQHVSEELYRTDKGNWFVAGEGGPLSHYREEVGGGWTNGSDLRPLPAGEAMNWLEERGKTEALENHFGSEIEDA